jgi:uncharacterized membrane protein
MSRRVLIIVIFVSVALNLFLIGGLVGGLVVGERLRAQHRPPAMARGPALWTAANSLPPEQRRAYRRILRGEGGEVRSHMREARMARTEAWRMLGDERLDVALAKQRLAEARNREMQARGGVEDRIVDFAAGLSPQERAELARGLAEPARGPTRQHRGPGAP